MTFSVVAGSVIAGKYRVERVLGQGGMGMVVAAVHTGLDRRVAIKVLLPEVAQNPELVARFDREARAASRIQSEHVAKVLDVDKLEDGAPFMVMEYLEGCDLADLVKTRGALPGQEAIEYVLQACEALAEAHVAGIVHRDLKPANLFLTRRADGSPAIKVLDFGISKIALASDHGQGMTQTSAVMGSPSYMSPEQLKSARSVDLRTDIWSLGIVLHELLTGEVAFKADTVPELYVNILQSPPTLLRTRRPDAPPAMEAIILRCLEKDPARRYASVGELATALGELAPPQARLSIDRILRITGMAPRAPSSQPSAPPPYTPPPPQYTPAPPMGLTGLPASSHRPGAYGPGSTPGYGPPQGGQPYPLRQASPPLYATAMPQRPAQGMTPATLTLVILVAIVVLGGGCMSCLCLSAAGSQQRHSQGGRSSIEQMVSALPFQRPAGWTTVSRGATSPPLSASCTLGWVRSRSSSGGTPVRSHRAKGRVARARLLLRRARRGCRS
jgi:serine/threonine-protein kinase